jgi:hypothetical protein
MTLFIGIGQTSDQKCKGSYQKMKKFFTDFHPAFPAKNVHDFAGEMAAVSWCLCIRLLWDQVLTPRNGIGKFAYIISNQ